jgi:hypothetical protein
MGKGCACKTNADPDCPPTDTTTGTTDPTTGTTDPTTGGGSTAADATTADSAELTCGLYCTTFFANCADFNPYPDEADCLEQCSAWTPGTDGDSSGDSVACRLGQALNAEKYDNPGYHCPEASPDSNMCN